MDLRALLTPQGQRVVHNEGDREGCKANEGDWVQCKSVAHFATAARFLVSPDTRTLSCYLIRATEAKYRWLGCGNYFGTKTCFVLESVEAPV